MKNVFRYTRKTLALLAMLLVCTMLLTACGDAYTEYASAYNKISAGGGIDADMNVTLVMDGETRVFSGNFKVDTTRNILYYQMSSDGETTTQFSDGQYLYVERGSEKIKYALGGQQPSAAPSDKGETPSGDAPTFNTSDFLNEFSSFLDAGKIRELGLLSPIDKAAVTKTTKSGDTYTLEVSNSIVKRFVNTLATNAGGSDTVQVTDLKNFAYSVTVKDGVVTGANYSGDVAIKVPASLSADGAEQNYSVNLKIQITFVNPGAAVNISLPATDGFKEVSGF